VLSLPRRIQLINWARRHDALIVEDDYDGEFVLSGAKTAALSGMAPDVCAYISTFS
jgi:GntR family transcriptional regulator/MocR family aminotransferase